MPDEFKIALNEEFPHLSRAPLVEAVIDIRARAGTAWLEDSTAPLLRAKLPDYPNVMAQRQLVQQFKLGDPTSTVADRGWVGLQFATPGNQNIAEFTHDGFAHHRLRPYEDWEKFSTEALRLWQIHVDVAQPAEIQHVGVRFIGRLELPVQDGRFEDYIDPAPKTPKDMDIPFVGFLHHDTLLIPGHPYVVNLIRTIQPPPPNNPAQGFAVILDIDVGTLQAMPLDSDKLRKCLAEMRWLKNKTFFGSITQKAQETYK